MNNRVLLLFILTILIISACNSKKPATEAETANSPSVDTVSILPTETTHKQVQDSFFCPRGQATPVLQKEDYPNATFVLGADSISAIETTDLETGDRLTVHTGGCEYLVYTFRFETGRFEADTTDLSYWYNVAHRLCTSMLGGTDLTLDMKKGLMHLGYYTVNNKAALKRGEEIDFGETDSYRNFVTLDRIEKLPNGRYAVSISFVEGPL